MAGINGPAEPANDDLLRGILHAHVSHQRLDPSVCRLSSCKLTVSGCSICAVALLCRLLQDAEGRYYIGSDGDLCEIPFTVTQDLQLKLLDLPSKYAEKYVSDAIPSNRLLPDLIPQMQPHLLLTGKEALLKVQLTQLQDGCVLGISFAHALSGELPLSDAVCMEDSVVILHEQHKADYLRLLRCAASAVAGLL